MLKSKVVAVEWFISADDQETRFVIMPNTFHPLFSATSYRMSSFLFIAITRTELISPGWPIWNKVKLTKFIRGESRRNAIASLQDEA